jgi:hypothetical protein
MATSFSSSGVSPTVFDDEHRSPFNPAHPIDYDALEGREKEKARAVRAFSTMAEREGFEPPCRLLGKTLSRRPRYDHFGTSPFSGARGVAARLAHSTTLRC